MIGSRQPLNRSCELQSCPSVTSNPWPEQARWPIALLQFGLAAWVYSLTVFMALLVPTALMAQSSPVAIEPSRLQPPLVLGRPMLTWWDVKIPGSGLVVGYADVP